MKRSDFFITALQRGSHKWKAWVIEAFALCDLPASRNELSSGVLQEDKREYPFALYKDTQGYYVYADDGYNEREYIEDADPSKPLLDFHDTLEIHGFDVENLREERAITTYGNLLFNYYVLIYAFGKKIPYINEEVSIKKIEKIIEAMLMDNPAPGEPRAEDKLYVDEYLRFNKAALALAGFSQLCVPSATPKALSTDPAVYTRREELLEQYKDQLNDPAIIAKIDAELIAMDRAWLADDADAMGFFIKSKSFDVIRKKQFLMHGAESGFVDGPDVTLIPRSLAEGWDINYLPEMANSLREGSYSRGSLTALGGAAVKETYRVAQNTKIVPEDCGSRLGLITEITSANKGKFIGNYFIVGGNRVNVTEENVGTFVGGHHVVSSPIYCRAPGADFCRFCVGDKLASTPTAIGTYLADVGSTFMGRFMAAMHGKVLATAKYVPAMAIT